MGNWSAANRKGQANSLSLKERVSFLYPQHGIYSIGYLVPPEVVQKEAVRKKCGKIE
jgi:hypothetical protein